MKESKKNLKVFHKKGNEIQYELKRSWESSKKSASTLSEPTYRR